jgi:hypothetical protein
VASPPGCHNLFSANPLDLFFPTIVAHQLFPIDAAISIAEIGKEIQFKPIGSFILFLFEKQTMLLGITSHEFDQLHIEIRFAGKFFPEGLPRETTIGQFASR